MKKLFLIIILTMVLFVGCSSNDTTQQEDKNKLLLENLRKEADLLLNKYEESENFIKKLNADISNLKYQQQEIQNEKDALKSKDNILSEKREILKSNNRILKEIIFNSDKDGIDYNQLTDEEKKQYQLIKNTIAKKIPYNIDLDYFEPEYGKIIFDFNNDNKVETLYYVTNKGKDQYNYTILDKCMIYINGMTIENEYHNNYEIRAGISHIGIIDVDLNDNYIEFYITQGNLSDRVLNSIYRLTEGGVELVGKFEGEILAFSGDGKIYYWGGNLFEPNEFNTDLVLSYFDFNEKKKFLRTKL